MNILPLFPADKFDIRAGFPIKIRPFIFREILRFTIFIFQFHSIQRRAILQKMHRVRQV